MEMYGHYKLRGGWGDKTFKGFMIKFKIFLQEVVSCRSLNSLPNLNVFQKPSKNRLVPS
jgi:hypothetical protein